MYHSLIIGKVDAIDGKFTPKSENSDTWVDWYLIPSSRPVINPPETKTKVVDIPGADWHLDLSTVLTGDIAYGSRTGSIDFIVDNGFLSDYKANGWYALYSEILNYLHGQALGCILEDEPDFYYKGRFSVNSWKSEKTNSKITIDYDLAPYKYERYSSLEDWEWDSFNFETGIIREYSKLKVDGKLTLNIIGRRMVVVPTFKVALSAGKSMKVRFNGVDYNLVNGDNRFVNIQTVEGDNVLEFIGNGEVSVNYRGGSL